MNIDERDERFRLALYMGYCAGALTDEKKRDWVVQWLRDEELRTALVESLHRALGDILARAKK